jgi:hypothetical protein
MNTKLPDYSRYICTKKGFMRGFCVYVTRLFLFIFFRASPPDFFLKSDFDRSRVGRPVFCKVNRFGHFYLLYEMIRSLALGPLLPCLDLRLHPGPGVRLDEADGE